MTRAVADLALLSDCQGAALVDRDGSIEWWCAPRFDSRPSFARLLDPQAGHLRLAPAGSFHLERRYRSETLVLESTYTTETGRLRVTDALALGAGTRGHDIGQEVPHVLARVAECLDGEVPVELEFVPRPDFGLVRPWLMATDSGVRTVGGPDTLALDTDLDLELARDAARAAGTLHAGERAQVVVRHRAGYDAAPVPAGSATAVVEETVAAWRSWTAQHQDYDGAYAGTVRHSALILQALTYVPTGALIAAPTTSLPEIPGGDANWDYRYAWLRDASLNLRALEVGACVDEADRYLRFIARAGSSCGVGHLPQVVFGVDGRRDLNETEVGHLAGFGGARPVRVGNAAWGQRQLDVPGEVLDAAHRLLADGEAPIEDWMACFLAGLADAVVDTWREDDSGIWEGREGERPYTTSKVLAWVALDRAVRLSPRLGRHSRAERWASERDLVRASVLEEAWNDEMGAYAGALGSDRLDAGVLLMPLFGFLPMQDERMRATVELIARELGEGGVVRRWTGSEEGGFAICSFWLAECLALAGETERAREVFEAAAAHANDVGLMSELIDGDGALAGNMPQAFVHAGLISAAAAIARAEGPGGEPGAR
ncbi:MAG: glycoside hydrolase family 15 protein [Actinomycetota bacterium]|nr:glycoside hydrolase family 15 protein [Actinomycetota bacterium]